MLSARLLVLSLVPLLGCASVDLVAKCNEGDGPTCAELARRHEVGEDVKPDAARAVSLHAKACEAGTIPSCLKAGFAYGRGVNVRLDLDRATALLERGCKGNDYDACSYAGALLVPLNGFLGDGVRAMRLFEHACHHGSAAGCYNAARRYEKGDVEGADAAREVQYYRRAVELAAKTCGEKPTSAPDCYALGYMAENGRAMPADLRRAAAAYGKACAAGEPFSCVKWARMVDEGHAKPEPKFDLNRAYAKACDAGAFDGCEALAEETARNGGSVIGQDYTVWISKACQHGSARACARAAVEYRKDEARVAAYLRGGCDARDPASCAALASAHEQGKGVAKDALRAAQLYERNCTIAGDVKGCRSAARMLLSGAPGLGADPRRALTMLEKACGLGDAQACEDTVNGLSGVAAARR